MSGLCNCTSCIGTGKGMEKDSSIEDDEEKESLTRNSNNSTRSSSSSGTTNSVRNSNQNSRKCRSIFINCDDKIVEKTHQCSMECVQRYPIHHAARLGRFDELRRLLEDPSCAECPLKPDECLGRTPLHYACSTGNVEKGLACVRILLECRQIMSHGNAAEKIKGYVNHLDHNKKSALHLAAENEATHIVITLLTNQACFDISSLDGTCALREIYKNTPDAMEVALHQSISYTETCKRPKFDFDDVSVQSAENNCFDFSRTCVNVCLDFYPVIGSKLTQHGVATYEGVEDDKCKTHKVFSPETRFLYTVNRKRLRSNVRRQILTNVLVQAFLYFKWQKIKKFCFIAIFFHILWLSLYIGTVINVFVMKCPYKNPGIVPQQDPLEVVDMDNGTRTLLPETEIPACELNLVTQLVAGLLLILSILVSVKEFFQFCRLRTLYIRFENMGQCILLGFIFFTIPPIYLNYHLTVTSPMSYQVSAFGIFLGWTLFLCQLSKLPRLTVRLKLFGRRGMIVFPDHGIYVEILSRVFKNFLIFISIFSSLLISFVFSFNILLPNSAGFINLTNAMVKVLTMMTGELNYDDIFHSEDSKLVYPVSSHVMYAIFIMVATIILFNLLIGFTVSDIQGLQKDAEINQISNKLEQIFLMECFLLSGIMQKLARLYAKLSFRGGVDLLHRIMVVKTKNADTLCYHTRIKVLPFHLRVKLRDHASRNCFAISDITGLARSKIFHPQYEH